MASSDQTPWLAALSLRRGSVDIPLPNLDTAAPAVASHPLRITHRDQLREDDLDAWFDSFQLYKLHVRVVAAQGLCPNERVPSPYCVLRCGAGRWRTAAVRRSLDPEWGEEFLVDFQQVAAGRRQLTVEVVSSCEFWRPDEVLGRAGLDLVGLALEPEEVLEVDLQLLPPEARPKQPKPPPRKPAPKPAKSKGGRGKGAASAGTAAAAAAGGAGSKEAGADSSSRGLPSPVKLLRQLSESLSLPLPLPLAQQQQRLQQPGSPRKQPGGSTQQQQHQRLQQPGSPQKQPGGSTLQQQQSFQQQQQQAASSDPPHQQQQDQEHHPRAEVVLPVRKAVPWQPRGTVRLALWWAPARGSSSGSGGPGGGGPGEVVERVSFALLPGDLKVPPLLTHARFGTLYEEPCYAYIKVNLLQVQLGPTWAAAAGAKIAQQQQQLLAQQARTSRHRHRHRSSSQQPSGLWSWLGLAGWGKQQAQGLLQQQQAALERYGNTLAATSAAPVHVMAVLRFGKHQVAESVPARVRPSGQVVFRENHVFITKRPLADKHVTLEVMLCGDGLPGGKTLASGRWSVVELLQASPPPPTSWTGVHQARKQQLPGVTLTLPRQGVPGSWVELVCHAADADGRAALLGVPALTMAAAAARAPELVQVNQHWRSRLLQQLRLRRGGEAPAAGPGPAPSSLPGLPSCPPDAGRPLAMLTLVLHRVDLDDAPPGGFWVLLKCGPHWARTHVRSEAEFNWQLCVPIYHPTATLLLVVYSQPRGRGRPACCGKLQYRISHLMALHRREQVKSLKLRSDAADASGGRPPVGEVLVSFTTALADAGKLLAAYERNPHPATVHMISLFKLVGRDVIAAKHHYKVVKWLSHADPPVEAAAAAKVLETGRERFQLKRARHNIQRLREAVSWVPALGAWHLSLKAWERPAHNLASVPAAYVLCFHTWVALAVLAAGYLVVALRRLLRRGLIDVLGVELGDLLDSTGLLPWELSDPTTWEEDEEEEEEDPGVVGAAQGAGGAGQGPQPAGGLLLHPRRIRALKRRYDQLQRIALQVQNRIDDVAMHFERLRAMVSGQDPLATALFFTVACVLAAALLLVGPGPLVFGWWCWEVLRPPSWRGVPGVKGPLQFLGNLPSRSTEEV